MRQTYFPNGSPRAYMFLNSRHKFSQQIFSPHSVNILSQSSFFQSAFLPSHVVASIDEHVLVKAAILSVDLDLRHFV